MWRNKTMFAISICLPSSLKWYWLFPPGIGLIQIKLQLSDALGLKLKKAHIFMYFCQRTNVCHAKSC